TPWTVLMRPVAGTPPGGLGVGGTKHRAPPQVGDERWGEADGAVRLLAVLEDGDDRARVGDGGPVERVDELEPPAAARAEPDVEPAGLKVRAVAARLGLPIPAPAGHPRLDIVLAGRGIAEVSGRDVDDPVGEPEVLPQPLLQGKEVVVLLPRPIGVAVREHLHLVELVDAEHPARVLAVRPGFPPEAGRDPAQ